MTCLTATAVNCLVFAGSAPSAKTCGLHAGKVFSVSGARARRFSESSLAFHLRSPKPAPPIAAQGPGQKNELCLPAVKPAHCT